MKPILSLISLLCAILLTSCGGNDEPKKEKSIPHRTVLVYMIADNTLGTWDCDDADIKEMLKAAEADGLNGGRLLIYHNRPGTERGNVPQLLEVTKTGLQTLKEYPDDPTIYSVSPSRIKEVLSDTKKLAKADDYGLVLWSHANGWLESNNDIKSRSFGEDRKKNISITDLGKALDGFYFSFIYFDCCLMGNVEVAYELRHATPIIVASPTELPIDGMPYDVNVPVFFADGVPDMSLAARNTYTSYANSVEPYCQMVVINTDWLDNLAASSRAIFNTVTEYPNDITSIQKYSIDSKCWSFDMKQYINLIAGNTILYAQWERDFDATIAYACSTPLGIGRYINSPLVIDTYNGLGSFIIQSPDDITYKGYNNCSWYKNVVSHSPIYRQQ